jgi:branched-chain amino acid transport system ATP-binding protein
MMASILEVRGIAKSFGALRVISDLTFDVRKGEILGLIGPNGAGKSTAINLIGGAMRPDQGDILFEGISVLGLKPHQLVRRGVVRTFQSTTVYPACKVRENVYRGAFTHTYPGFWHGLLDTPRSRASRAGGLARTDALLEELGLSAVAEQAAGSLPYGFQKMLGLAIALAAGPRLIMMDEPAAGLSAEEADRITTIIRAINKRGVSVIVVDHNMRFIKGICDRVVVLHHGTELMVGTPSEVTSDPRVIEAYLGIVHEPA